MHACAVMKERFYIQRDQNNNHFFPAELRSMHRQLHQQLRSRRKCQTRLVQKLLVACCQDTIETMVLLYSSTLENPNLAGKIHTGHGLGMCGSASHASATLELNRSCVTLWYVLEVAGVKWTMDLICHCTNVCVLILEIFKCQTISTIPSHWGQQEDLESPQVARLPQKSLVKVPKFLRILTLQVMKPMKPNARWKRWK